ncbi:MAG: hypothetical protein K2O18_11865 [Oscillospiraceae bacterium]|nr:hypothetical protein [Oscillospiraceae bacterium]
MKLLGTILILLGAAGLFILRRREGLLPLRVGQAVAADLAVLRREICVCRRPLPEICTEILTDGPGAAYLWGPLGRYLQENECSLPDCWARAAAALPAPLGPLLAPLGPLLPAGGEQLADAVEQTREELSRFLRAEAERQAACGKITAALCLSGACLVILVLI